MNPEIKQRIEQIKNGEVPEGYTNKYHIKPDSWQDEPLNMFFYKVKEKNHEKRYSTVFTNSAANGVIPQNEYFEKDIANEENIDGYYVVNVGDYIYNPRISEKALYGPINQNLTGYTGIASPLYTVFSKKENVCICDDYIRYYLDSAEWNKYIYSVANYGARFDRMNISDSDFMKMPIALPQIEEQKKIAEILMQCDKVIELKKRRIEEEKKLKRWMLENLLNPDSGIRLQGFKEDWKKTTFGDICKFINGRAYAKDELLAYGKYPVLRVGNLFTKSEWYYSDMELDDDKYIDFGDLIYAWSASFGPMIWKYEKVIYHYHIWKVITNQCIEQMFLYHYLNYDVMLMERAKQGGTMSHITKTVMEQRTCFLPNIDEQKAISAILDEQDNVIKKLEKEQEQWKEKKESLMQLLLKGIVRVQA